MRSSLIGFAAGLAVSAFLVLYVWPATLKVDLTEVTRCVDEVKTASGMPAMAQDLGFDGIYASGPHEPVIVVDGQLKFLVDKNFVKVSQGFHELEVDPDGGFVGTLHRTQVQLAESGQFATYTDDMNYFKSTVTADSGMYHIPN